MNEGQFISYCSNVIKGLNKNRFRDKKLVNTKNTLVERNDVFELNFDISEESYNFEIDEKIEEVKKLVREQPLKGQILFESVVKSTREIASELGLNQRKMIYENVKFKSELKRKLR